VLERDAGIEIRSRAKVSGLITEDAGGRPRTRGVVLDDGTHIDADFVIDAGGRKSQVGDWLRRAGARLPAEEIEDCGITYYTRYFRAHGDAPDPWALFSCQGNIGYGGYAVFPGDRGTYGVVIVVGPWDRDLKALRHDHAWDLAAASVPAVEPWVAADYAEAFTSVNTMAGLRNVLRPFLDDGIPAHLGCLPVGDALITVNATTAWGVSLALTHGFAAARALSTFPDDPGDAALAYAADVMHEVQACFRVSATTDRMRVRYWRDGLNEPHSPDEEREFLVALMGMRIFEHPVIMRAMSRRMMLMEPPNAIFENAEFMAMAREMIGPGGEIPTVPGPSRDELVRMISLESAVK